MREALTEKILILGVDGMDPRLTRKFIDAGLMPNTKQLLEKGSARADLMMLGGQPTVTPPMWTTLATGCSPMVHGITDFSRQCPTDLDMMEYNLDSRNCKAEPLWNVFAEAGKKTLVWHWPGSSWPPTSDNPNLSVVDGTQPGTVNMGTGQVESESLLVADVKTETVVFREKAACDSKIPCVITDLKADEESSMVADMMLNVPVIHNVILTEADDGGNLTKTPFDVAMSPIKAGQGWMYAPDGAREFTLLLSKGLVRRVGLILPNEAGIYDHIALYKSKKDAAPLVSLQKNVFTQEIVDDAVKGDKHYTVSRNMRVLELAEDGSHLKMWISAAMDIAECSVWHPQSLYQEVVKVAGYPISESNLGGSDLQLARDCMHANWEAAAVWQAKALNYLIAEKGYDIIFSHFHNIDAHGHMIWRFLKDKGDAVLPHETYLKLVEDVYTQTDRYIGQFLHLLEEDWTILVVSDHAQVSSEYGRPLICSGAGCNVRIMQELGLTYVKKDDNGNELKEIDWARTKAVANRANHIYINLKGRDKHGIVEPEDKYAVEEEVMTKLYGYRHPVTGQRIIALALRNKDAVLLGLGGPECGDIVYFTAEGYNGDHSDSLSTTLGFADTSVSPIFIAAGRGIKQGFVTERYVRSTDLAPTVAFLGGVRMPAQCEGAPAYQIFTEEY